MEYFIAYACEGDIQFCLSTTLSTMGEIVFLHLRFALWKAALETAKTPTGSGDRGLYLFIAS